MKTAEQIAEKLWDRNKCSYSVNGEIAFYMLTKENFLAALKDYGELVRQRAAEKANEASPNGFDIGAGDGAATVFEKTRKACAAAVERMELP